MHCDWRSRNWPHKSHLGVWKHAKDHLNEKSGTK